MKKYFTIKKIFMLSLLALLNTTSIFAQSNGDYRSVASGNWTVPATWEKYNGSGWDPASTSPTSADGVITISVGSTVTANASVTVDQLVVQTNAVLIIGSGTFKIIGSTNTLNGTLSISSIANLATATDQIFMTNGSTIQLQEGGQFTGNASGSAQIFTDGTCSIIVSSSSNTFYPVVLAQTGTLTITSNGSSGFIDGGIYVGPNSSLGPVVMNIPSSKQITFNSYIKVRPQGTVSGSGMLVFSAVNAPAQGNTAAEFQNNGVVSVDVKFQPTSVILQSFTSTTASGSARTWGNVEINNNVTVTAASSKINGILTLASGTFNNSSNNITLGNSASIIRANGSLTAAPTFGTSVDVTYSGSSATPTSYELPTSTSVLNNLSINNSNIVTLSANQTVNGILSIATGTLADGGFTVIAKGNVANSAMHSGSGKILLSGGASSHILSGSGTYGNVQMNDVNGATLTGSPTLNGTLTLTNGKITTDANTITIGSSGSISGGSSSSYVEGKLARIFGAIGSKNFAIGKSGNYRPLSINYTSLDNPSIVTAEQFETALAGSVLPGITLYNNRHWEVTQTGASSFLYNITLDGTGFNPTNTAKIIKENGTQVAYDATVSSNNFTATGFSTFSGYGVGQLFVPTISGNAGVAGATISYTDGSPKTAIADDGGIYTFTVSNNWSGTVTPSKAGYTFSPSNYSYTNTLTDQAAQNFTASAITYSISGNVGIAGATLSYNDGGVQIATADGSGNYTFTVPYSWSGTVTPAMTGHTFLPANIVYTNVLANLTAQNYIALVSISGNAGVAGTTISYTDGIPKTTTADGSGNYSLTVSNNWSGSVTPSKTGYSFLPTDIAYSNPNSPQT